MTGAMHQLDSGKVGRRARETKAALVRLMTEPDSLGKESGTPPPAMRLRAVVANAWADAIDTSRPAVQTPGIAWRTFNTCGAKRHK